MKGLPMGPRLVVIKKRWL